MYAKLQNNILIPAPHEVIAGEQRIFNPLPELLRELGYKEVIYSPADPAGPSDGLMREVYIEQADSIRVSYVEADPAAAPDPAALREQAYRAQADQYLAAHAGYLLEGRTAEAEAQKALYLEAKARIREEYPDPAAGTPTTACDTSCK